MGNAWSPPKQNIATVIGRPQPPLYTGSLHIPSGSSLKCAPRGPYPSWAGPLGPAQAAPAQVSSVSDAAIWLRHCCKVVETMLQYTSDHFPSIQIWLELDIWRYLSAQCTSTDTDMCGLTRSVFEHASCGGRLRIYHSQWRCKGRAFARPQLAVAALCWPKLWELDLNYYNLT
jgi:hypothetical protein